MEFAEFVAVEKPTDEVWVAKVADDVKVVDVGKVAGVGNVADIELE